MTVVLGVLCRDGAILGSAGASSQMSSGSISYERAEQKVWILQKSRVFGATSGNTTIGQRVKVGIDRFFKDSGTDFADSFVLGDCLRKRVCQELADVDLKPSKMIVP